MLRRLARAVPPLVLAASAATSPLLAGCGGRGAVTPVATNATKSVFDRVVPSVVAIVNDDRALREEESRRTLAELGVESTHAPKTVIDVSARKEPLPHGTGFLVEGGRVVTAAHVVLSPDHLKITTRGGETVDAELELIDEVRDVAVLRPKKPLAGVRPIALAKVAPEAGRKVWALGHTGAGLWALQWGISEGITSGTVTMLGADLLLFDAPVYPGFSGGPVVTLDDAGEPVVLGVNHAILFTGGVTPVASISSASSAEEVRDVLAKKPPPIQPVLAEFVKKRSAEPRAELFVSRSLSIHKDPQMMTSASILGDEKVIETGPDDLARVPVVAMLFGLAKGDHELAFELLDPHDRPVETTKKTVHVGEHERVAFASADFRFEPKLEGRHDVLVKSGGKVVGRTNVWIEDPDDDDQPLDDEDLDDVDGDPRVDVVVAAAGRQDPLALAGIRAGWVEWRYPRRVSFTWFARGTRGWSGTNVAIGAYVLDETGTIVGRGVGCVQPELRPEHPFSCAGAGGTPLLRKEGRYDVVFALNDRPIALWPMEAIVKTGGKSAMERWIEDLKKRGAPKKHKKR